MFARKTQDNGISRRDLQPLIDTALSRCYRDNKILLDRRHQLRLIRCLLRCASRLAMACGVSQNEMFQLLAYCRQEEVPTTHAKALSMAGSVCFVPEVVEC